MLIAGIKIASGVLLAQAQPESGESLPLGLDIFVRPRAERRKPSSAKATEGKPITTSPQPPAVSYQEIPVSDDLYEEFLTLGEAYQETQAALNEEEADRQILEERVVELERDFTAKINTLLARQRERDRKLEILGVGLAGGFIIVVLGGTALAVKMIRSQNRKLHEARLRAIDESEARLREDWEQHSREIAEEAASRAVEEWEKGRRNVLERTALAQGQNPLRDWRDWMLGVSPASPPPSTAATAQPTVTRLDQLTFEAFVRRSQLRPNITTATLQLAALSLRSVMPGNVIRDWGRLTEAEQLDYLKAEILSSRPQEAGYLPRSFFLEVSRFGVTNPTSVAQYLTTNTDWFGPLLPETRTELATVMAHWLNGIDRPERDAYFFEDQFVEAFAAKAREVVVEIPAGARSGQARRAHLRRRHPFRVRLLKEEFSLPFVRGGSGRGRSILELSRGVGGFTRITAPFVGLDVAEYFELINSGQKIAIIGGLIAGMTWVERWTPAHLLALAPAFALGGQITEAGLTTFGVEHPLVRKAGKTVGSFAAAEGFLTWVGKGAGAQSLREAHRLGREVLHSSLVHTVQSVASAGSRFANQVKGLFPAAGAVVAVAAVGKVILGSAAATAGVALAVGAAAFSAVHYSGVGERLGNIAGDAAFYGVRKLRNWFSPFS